MSERLRLFVALDLPEAVRETLAAWCDRVAPEGVRRIPEGNLHLTLAFLGPRSSDEAAAVAGLLPRLALAHPQRPMATMGALWLPPRRPTVLTLAIGASEKLAALRAGLVAAIADAIAFSPEQRAFQPHVTVGRVVGAAAQSSLRAPLPTLTFAAQALTLYRSVTDPGGTRYEPLARAPFGGGQAETGA